MTNLKSYSGFRVSNPAFREHEPGWISFHYATDLSGTVAYRFNSYGFRGEEFNPEAKARIFVAGESTAIGVGISEEQSWFGKFKGHYCEQRGLQKDSVNLLNFSQAGASTDYTCRVLLQQCEMTRPDLVVAVLSSTNRIELLLDDDIGNLPNQNINVLPFLGNALANVGNKKTSLLTPAEKSDLLESIDAFYTFYTNRQGLCNQINNVLLLQNYFNNCGIPYLIWVFHQHDCRPKIDKINDNMLSDLAGIVDDDLVISMEYDQSGERAADGIHVGPVAQENIAYHLAAAYKKNYAN